MKHSSDLANATILAGLCRLTSTGLSFVLLIALTRLLGPVEYGRFVFLLSIGLALGLVFPLGQSVLVLKHYRPQAGPADNARLLHTNFTWMLRGAILLIAAGSISITMDRSGGLYAACCFAAVFSLSEYLVNYFRLQGRMLMALVPRENAWRALILLTIPAVILLKPSSLTGETAFLIATSLLLLIVAIQLVAFLCNEGLTWLREPRAREPNASWRGESRYFIGSSLLDASSGYLDTIVIGTLIGLKEAAIYFTALRISKLLEIPKTILDTVGAPRVAQAFQRGDYGAAQRLLQIVVAASFLPTSVAAIAAFLVGEYVLGTFDPSFVQGANVLTVLLLATVLHVAFGASEYTMKIAGGERTHLVVHTALMCLYLVLLTALGLTLGVIGIAVANLIHISGRGLATAWWCRRRLSIDPTVVSALKAGCGKLLPELNTAELRGTN